MGTRAESLVNQPCTLGFRHIYAGVLQDIFQIIGIQIVDQNNQQILFIPPSQIQRLELGTYQATIPGNYLPTPGTYRDIWSLIPVPAASVRILSFDINVVLQSSQPTVTFPGSLQCSLADLDACMLKTKYLWPVWSALANGYYLPDNVLQFHIDNGITFVQRQLGIPLQQIRVLTFPYSDSQTPANPVLGVDYDEEGDLVQWSAVESLQWSSVRLPHTGIIRVRGLRGIYGGRTVYRIPTDWVDRNELKMGLLRVRPTTTGSIANIVDNSGRFLDVTLLESIGANFVPGFWAVDYDYGQPNSKFPREICDVIMKKASIILLDQLGMAISKGLGGRSASVDGLSSSINYVANAERSMFGALARRYEDDLAPENLLDMRRYYKGPSVFIL